MLAGLPASSVLHAAAQFVLGLQPRDHVSAALQTLHWLPVRQRITYKLCLLMHGVAFGYAPTYLLDAIVRATLSAARKSSSTVGGQWMFRRTTSVMVGRISSILCCRPTSLEQTACSPSTY